MSSFSNCREPQRKEKKKQNFLLTCWLSLIRPMYIRYQGFCRQGHQFYLMGHFSAFRFRYESCSVHYISVTLLSQGYTAVEFHEREGTASCHTQNNPDACLHTQNTHHVLT